MIIASRTRDCETDGLFYSTSNHLHWTERVISAARGCLSMMLVASHRYTALLSSAAARNMKVFLERVPGGRVLKTTLF